MNLIGECDAPRLPPLLDKMSRGEGSRKTVWSIDETVSSKSHCEHRSEVAGVVVAPGQGYGAVNRKILPIFSCRCYNEIT